MANITRTFTDLDIGFSRNPISDDVSVKNNENAIKQSVANLILTSNGERPFHPEIGSQIRSMLFEPFNYITKSIMERMIYDTIENFEPRVKIISVDVQESPDNNGIVISIVFKIVNTFIPVSLNLTLERTR